MKHNLKTTRKYRILSSWMLMICMLASNLTFANTSYSAYAKGIDSDIKVTRDAKGMPIFDSVPNHLNPTYLKQFVYYIMNHDLSDEDLVVMANPRQPDNRDSKNPKPLTRKVKAGYELPLFVDGQDHVQGVYTDLPDAISVGDSWNKKLANQIGNVIGNEYRGSVKNSEINKMLVWTAVADIRTNPLTGRYEEGIGEDPVLTGELASDWASGTSGVNTKDSEKSNDFWLKTALQSKHYANYASEWFRNDGSYNIGNRGLNEYQLPAFIKQLSLGSVTGFMTSYGRTNGIPNGTSPSIRIAQKANPFGTLILTDYNAPASVAVTCGNGYDKSYVPDNSHLAALYAKVGSSIGTFDYNGSAGSPSKQQGIDGIASGLFGVTMNDIKEAVRPTLETLVRIGYFNAKDSEGNPIGYPYTYLMKNKVTETDLSSQQTAMAAAHEGIVLLKNDNQTLPLKKNSNAAVIGPLADINNKGNYAVEKTPKLTDAGLTYVDAIKQKANVVVDSGTKVVALQSLQDGSYLSNAKNLIAGVDSKATSNGEFTYKLPDGRYVSANEAVEVYDWGQDYYSFASVGNNKFLTVGKDNLTFTGEKPTGSGSSVYEYQPAFAERGAFKSMYKCITVPNTQSFFASREMKATSQYVTVKADDKVSTETDSDHYNKEEDKSACIFKEQVIEEPGKRAASLSTSSDYAIIFIGAQEKMHSGEGPDRLTLNMGNDMYQLVSNAAKSFAEKGKKTIVVINSNYPVAMDQIQNNPDVNAIVFAPYGGQYEGKALADILYGDYAPTGRLTSTWYKDISSFPKLNRYDVPEGGTYLGVSFGPNGVASSAKPVGIEDIDSKNTVDMLNADPVDTKMTYMYSDAEITYPFGYGLSYSEFKYSNLKVSSTAKKDSSFNVSVDVTNTGNISTDEVVQLYAANPNSSYGEFAPKKKLAAFEKVTIPAGKTKTVTLKVDPDNLALFDVSSQKNDVEAGKYVINVGSSSTDIKCTANINLIGKEFSAIDLSKPKNVWDYSVGSNNLVYREVSKERSTNFAGQYYAVMSADVDSWSAIPNVNMKHASGVKLRVASTNSSSTIQIRKGSPTGKLLASVKFGPTGETTYKVPSSKNLIAKIELAKHVDGGVLHELGYKVVTAGFTSVEEGNSDLYLVYSKADIRVDSIQLLGQNQN